MPRPVSRRRNKIHDCKRCNKETVFCVWNRIEENDFPSRLRLLPLHEGYVWSLSLRELASSFRLSHIRRTYVPIFRSFWLSSSFKLTKIESILILEEALTHYLKQHWLNSRRSSVHCNSAKYFSVNVVIFCLLLWINKQFPRDFTLGHAFLVGITLPKYL